jgi:pimeloyl-ACP methyl ester carboxylesterase
MASVEIAGRTVHYRSAGPTAGGGRRRVLYVHGTGCDGRVWVAHMQALGDAYTAVAIDLPGHGQSPGPGSRGVADYAHAVVELARALGWSRFVVAGHSMGGAVALTTAIYHADLLAGLVLVDTGARLRVHPTVLEAARRAAEAGRPAVTDRSWAFAAGTPQSVVDAVHAITAGTDPWVTYGDWIADDMFDVMARVQDIRVPTLAICGAEDRLTPLRYHQFLESRIPGCRLAVIEGAGHWVFHEQPEAFTRTVRAFLDGLPAG